MTIRITVHNDCAMPGKMVAVRTMSHANDMGGEITALDVGCWQTYFLHKDQFIIAAEVPDSMFGGQSPTPAPAPKPTVTA